MFESALLPGPPADSLLKNRALSQHIPKRAALPSNEGEYSIEMGWYGENKKGAGIEKKTAVIYCGGNMEDNMLHNKYLDDISEKTGVPVFAFNYPGFGPERKSRPTVEKSIAAAETVTSYLIKEGYTVVPLGWSVGGAIATNIAKKYETPLLGLNSTFTSARAAAKAVTPQLIHPLIDIASAESNLNSGDVLENMSHKMRVVHVHGDKDTVIGYAQSEELNRIMDGNSNIQASNYKFDQGDHASTVRDINDKASQDFIQSVNALSK